VVKVDAKTRKILDDYLTERIKKTNSTTTAAPTAAAAAVPVPGAEKKEGEAEVGLSRNKLFFAALILSQKAERLRLLFMRGEII
jgi:hypothetical protein